MSKDTQTADPVSIEECSVPGEKYPDNRVAKPGYVWQCVHCGKKSRDVYGMHPVSYGYDESCALNARLVRETP